MVIKDLLAQKQLADELIKRTHEKREKEFFDVHMSPSKLKHAPRSRDVREQGWIDLFGVENPRTHKKETTRDFWIEHSTLDPNVVFACFSNGLKIADKDYNVSFGAYVSKETVDQPKAIQMVRMAAFHLYRRGDRLQLDAGGSNYPGSKPYQDAFNAAYKEIQDVSTKQALSSVLE